METEPQDVGPSQTVLWMFSGILRTGKKMKMALPSIFLTREVVPN